MREPAARAFSEWRMFALKYKWDRDGNFSSAMARAAARLRDCDPSLYGAPQRLRALRTKPLARYLRKCFGGGRAMQYLATSLYAVCIEHALRLFRREQFLFLRYEDVRRMKPGALIALFSRFTGLSAPVHGGGAPLDDEATRSCTPSHRAPTRQAAAPEQLVAAAAPLRRLFESYNLLLAEQVHPAFGWSAGPVGGRSSTATSTSTQS